MEEKRTFGLEQLEDLKNRLAIKESLEVMYSDAKSCGDAFTMYSALMELGEQGLIYSTDARLKPAAMGKLVEACGGAVDNFEVDEAAAAEFKWLRTTRTRYGGNKMTEAEEIEYLTNKGSVGSSAGKKTSSGTKKSSSVTVTGVRSGTDIAREERRAEKLTAPAKFEVNIYEHVSLRREYGQVGLITVPENKLSLSCEEILTGHMAVRTLDKSFDSTRFAYGLVKDTNKFLIDYETKRKTLLEIRKASGTFDIDRVAIVEVAWGTRDGKLAANARVGLNKESLIKNHIDLQEFVREATKAIKECLGERKGRPCEVKVLMANLKQSDIDAQKAIKKRDRSWVSRINTEDGDRLLREVLFEEEKAARKK